MISSPAPIISATGITAPSYDEILTYLQAQYRSIYGADLYLGNDSQDGQFLAIIALAINDSNSACVAAYNSFSPITAQGRSLSSNVKINGITRQAASKSTADVLITGVYGTTITDGVIGPDASNLLWNLPTTVLIPISGQVTVTATCQADGSNAALANTLTTIATPQYGWQSVTNPTAAVVGQPVETDAELRARQLISVALPAQSIFEGIVASVANVAGVTRLAAYENDSDITDANGIEPHTVALVVEGGVTNDIATAIALKKTPGTGTHGLVQVTVIDANGSSHIIKFDRPIEQPIHVALSISGLVGYSTSVLPLIKQSIVDYINALGISAPVNYFDLLIPAKLDNQGAGLTYKVVAMTTAKGAGAFGVVDLSMLYDEVASGSIANVVITVV